MRISKKWVVAILALIPVSLISLGENTPTVKTPYLTCPIVRERVHDFLHYHYVFRSFDAEISKRTFVTYFKLLDPGKLYFTQADLDSFAPYETMLGQKIDNVDCRFVSEVYDLYKQRVSTATQIANKILNTPFDFSKEEFIETDRKKINWAKNPDELNERWRKSLKFIVLNMKDSQSTKSIVDRLKKRYQIILKDVTGRSADDIHALFLNAFALSLDPHSSFLTPIDNAQFQIDFSLKLVGIGATLMSPDGYTTIDAVVPGGAAAKDGRLKKGDKIIAVDSGDGSGMQDVIDMDLDKVVQLIRGKEGTTVKLLVLRKSTNGLEVKRLQIDLIRAVVQIKDSEAKSDIMPLSNKKIGIINLPSFYIDYRDCQENPLTCRSSANDMAREIKKLKAQNVDGIILDLRRNGGGDLSEVQKMVGLFINNPIVTQVEDREHQVRSLDSDANALYTGPLAVLVSKYTASASEILAGAVQDYGRQTNGAIHVTIAKFFRPSGKSNQEKGVLSDVIIPDILDGTDIGEDESDYALPYTVIKPSRDFIPEQNLSSIVQNLQQLSTNRVERESSFKDTIEALKKAKSDKNTLVSLSEDSIKKTKPKKDDKKNSLDAN
jgi:carboxyl-terminal processing protease